MELKTSMPPPYTAGSPQTAVYPPQAAATYPSPAAYPQPVVDQQPASYSQPAGYTPPAGYIPPEVNPQLASYPQPVPAGVASAPPMVVVQPVLVQRLGPTSTVTVCKSCKQQIETRVEYESSMKTHVIAFALCLVGCGLCAFIPYCTDICKTANHYCPSCNSYVGGYDQFID